MGIYIHFFYCPLLCGSAIDEFDEGFSRVDLLEHCSISPAHLTNSPPENIRVSLYEQYEYSVGVLSGGVEADLPNSLIDKIHLISVLPSNNISNAPIPDSYNRDIVEIYSDKYLGCWVR